MRMNFPYPCLASIYWTHAFLPLLHISNARLAHRHPHSSSPTLQNILYKKNIRLSTMKKIAFDVLFLTLHVLQSMCTSHSPSVQYPSFKKVLHIFCTYAGFEREKMIFDWSLSVLIKAFARVAPFFS